MTYSMTAIEDLHTRVNDISVAPDDDNVVWGIRQMDGAIIARDPVSGTWTEVPGVSKGMASVAVGAMTPAYKETLIQRGFGMSAPAKYRAAWAVGQDQRIWKHTGEYTWTSVAGALVQIATAWDGTTVGVNQEGYVFQWTTSGFQAIDDQPRWCQVAVASKGAVFGIRKNKEGCFRYDGASWSPFGAGRPTVCANGDGLVLLCGDEWPSCALFSISSPQPLITFSQGWVKRCAMGPRSIYLVIGGVCALQRAMLAP